MWRVWKKEKEKKERDLDENEKRDLDENEKELLYYMNYIYIYMFDLGFRGEDLRRFK